MTDVSTIDEFFESHPLKEHYFRFAADDRRGACAVAERDVCAAAGLLEIPPDREKMFLPAVAEQCVYLLLNPIQLTGAADILDSESSAGSSRSFRMRKNPLCLRAAALLAPLTGAGGGAVTICRG